MFNAHRIVYPVETQSIASLQNGNPNMSRFGMQQRGLRHCLSSVGRQCESLICGMSDEFRFPRFLFSVFMVNAGLGILGDKKCDEWALA